MKRSISSPTHACLKGVVLLFMALFSIFNAISIVLPLLMPGKIQWSSYFLILPNALAILGLIHLFRFREIQMDDRLLYISLGGPLLIHRQWISVPLNQISDVEEIFVRPKSGKWSRYIVIHFHQETPVGNPVKFVPTFNGLSPTPHPIAPKLREFIEATHQPDASQS